MRQRDPVAIHNERVKLLAGFVNTRGLGFIGFAFIRPIVEGSAAFNAFLIAFSLTGLALHGIAHYLLRYLKVERSNDSL